MDLSRIAMMLGASAVLSCAGGCVVVKEYAPPKETVSVKTQEYDLAKKLLQAFVKNDAKAFVALLPEETRSKFTEKSFADTRKAVLDSVGEPISYRYLTTLKLPTLSPQVWVVCFRRYNVNRSKEFTSEVLFKVVTGMTSSKEAVITGFHFL